MKHADFGDFFSQQLNSLDHGLAGFVELFQAISSNMQSQIEDLAGQLRSHNAAADGEAESLRAQLVRRDEELAQLRRLVPVAEDKAEENKELQQARQQLHQLKEQLGDAQALARERSELDARSRQLQAQVQQLQQKLQEQTQRAAADRAQIERLTQERDHAGQRVAELEHERASLPTAAASVDGESPSPQEFRKLEEAFERVRSDGITAWDRVYDLEKNVEELQAALHSAQSDGITAWDRVYELEAKLESDTSAAEATSTAADSGVWEEKSAMHRRMVENEDEIASLRASLAKARAQAQSAQAAQSSSVELQNRLEAVEAKLLEVSTERDLAIRRLRKLVEQVRALQGGRDSAARTQGTVPPAPPIDPDHNKH